MFLVVVAKAICMYAVIVTLTLYHNIYGEQNVQAFIHFSIKRRITGLIITFIKITNIKVFDGIFRLTHDQQVTEIGHLNE